MSENELQRLILDALEVLPGVYAWRSNCGAAKKQGRYIRYGIPGQGDISGIMQGGRRLEIEVKVGKGQPSEEQEVFGARITALGGLYIVARNVDEAIHPVVAALVHAGGAT